MSAKEQKHTRLQRLLGLLETGSSEATRKAAARQITDICRSHPQQLPSVVRKVGCVQLLQWFWGFALVLQFCMAINILFLTMQVHSLLLHKSWETRTAAGEALGLLADAFPHATVTDLAAAAGVQQRAAEASQPQQNAGGEALQVSALEAFHLQTILDRGTALLASGGKVRSSAKSAVHKQA
jgi:TATA-binding protein-associated factor